MDVQRCKGCARESTELGAHGYCQECDTALVYRGYTIAELSDAFDRVKDRENWKLPIDKSLAGTLSAAEQSTIAAAVVFYAGCVPSFRVEGGLCGAYFTRVTAAGYYAAVGA